MRVLSINGPNLNMLGTREPEVYGSATLEELESQLSSWGEQLGVEVEHLHSNDESELIDSVHASRHDGIIINPGALTHTSRALSDAISSIAIPVVEVHISNVKEREPWRRTSVLDTVTVKSIYGRGLIGYRDALRHLVNRAAFDFETISYGPHPDQVGDLRRGGSGLVVLVHGGFWRHEWTRDTTESLAVDLAQRGFDTWNIEYRRIGSGGGWPGSAHDVLMAVEFSPQLASGMETVILLGHSAGAHLGLWAGAHSKVEVRAMVALAPVSDLAAHASSGLFGAPEAQSLLDAGAPKTVSPGQIPTLILHGDEDDHVPLEQSARLADRNTVDLLTVSGGHLDLLDPGKAPWHHVLEWVRRS